MAEPNGVTSPRELGIDWPRTVAWGEGGYYCRLCLNIEVLAEDGAEIEMRDLDEEVYRTTEELGIDMQCVRMREGKVLSATRP